ncbi:MAG: NAD(+)--dinitrogen-reductase ADP-D-ribosyltransferase [Gammaproteobacteria bacterium]|nr:NAD(+)--dinitrogen-reductase ADP-D-ribosyltransferase [Gammaproteobacteria bacterium]
MRLPRHARLPINRCSLPPQILGGPTFQQHPATLQIDGVQALHGHFFERLDTIADAARRAAAFKDYMRASFSLDRPDEAGLQPGRQRVRRDQADYLRMLRGWMFDADGREAAVLKGWVESRFGLLPRYHRGPLGDFSGANYQSYLAARSHGLYNTNALEAQVDLLYTFCQYELSRRYRGQRHLRLFRGTNRIEAHDVLARPDRGSWILLLNNLTSFSGDAERADEFGDLIISSQVPLAKILYLPGLFPGTLNGEQEYLVIGGVYRVDTHTLLGP